MNFFRSRVFVACVASTTTAIALGGIAWAAQGPVDASGAIHGCYNPRNGVVHVAVAGGCSARDRRVPLTWNIKGQPGPRGATGSQGPQGPKGPAGPQGAKGDAGATATMARIPIPEPDQGCSGDSDTSWFFPKLIGLGTNVCSTVEQPSLEITSTWFDPSQYPTGAVVTARWWLSLTNTGSQTATACVRLYDLDAHAPVAGTASCISGASMTVPTSKFVTSPPIAVSAAVHHYVIQWQSDFPQAGQKTWNVKDTELVVDW